MTGIGGSTSTYGTTTTALLPNPVYLSPEQLKKLSNFIHGGLGTAGLIPGPVGNVALAADGIFYLSQGDLKNAGLSGIGAIPVVGFVRDGRIIATFADEAAESGFKLTDTVVKNAASRPYVNSPHTIEMIMSVGKGVPDISVPGALRYDVPGNFGESYGTYELVVDPNTKTVYHFLFTSK